MKTMQFKKATRRSRRPLAGAALLLAGLLAGCAASPASDAPSAPQSATSQTATSEQAAAQQTGVAPALWSLQPSYTSAVPGARGVYEPYSGYGDVFVATCTDWETGVQTVLCDKPGCTHADASCPAALGPAQGADSRVYEIGDRLVWMVLGNGDGTADISDLDGGDRTPLAEGIPVTNTNWPYTDGAAVYWWDANRFIRLDLNDGGIQTLYETTETDWWPVGVSGDTLVLRQGSMDKAGGALRTVDTAGNAAEPTPLPDDTRAVCAKDGRLYWLAPAGAGWAVQSRALDGGEAETLAELPDLAADSSPWADGIYGGVLCFSANEAGQTRSYALDLATNTLNERPASYTPDGKSPQPYQICCGNDSWLYVQTGADARTIRYIGDDGQMKTGRRDVIRTGIMTPADYAAASLDARPCTRLDAWG